jgi:branched-chain amino acid transport system substrate-binding protein
MSDVNAATSFIKQAGEVGIEALIVCDGLGWLGEWYDLTGPASDFVLDMIPQFSTETAMRFVAEYTERHGYEPGPSTAGLAYDVTGMFIKVLQQTLDSYGEITRETAMRCAEEYLMTGRLTYSMRDDGAIMIPRFDYSDPAFYPDPIVAEAYYMFPVVQYFGGQGVVVWPDSMATHAFSVPANWGN